MLANRRVTICMAFLFIKTLVQTNPNFVTTNYHLSSAFAVTAYNILLYSYCTRTNVEYYSAKLDDSTIL
jgi:hypothetical protein